MKLNQKIAVAADVGTAPSVLQQLAQGGNAELRRVLARNPNLPVEILEYFADDGQVSVRLAVAQSDKTPSHILEKLARDAHVLVRRSVAANSNTPQRALERLSEDGQYEIQLAVSKNASTPTEVLENLFDKLGKAGRKQMARSVPCHPPFIKRLAKDPERAVRSKLGHNPNLSDDMLFWLVDNGDQYVKASLASRTSGVPNEMYEIFLRPENRVLHARLARNPSAPSDVLVRIFETRQFEHDQEGFDPDFDKYSHPISGIASNPNTPEDIQLSIARQYPDYRYGIGYNKNAAPSALRILADGEDLHSRCRAAEHEATPADCLIKLTRDTEFVVRKYALWNKSTPEAYRTDEIKALDKAEQIRSWVAGDRDTSEEVLSLLSKDEGRDVRAAVARNPNSPKETLRWLADSGDDWLRTQVARNPNASQETLNQLWITGGNKMADALASNPSTPIELLSELATHTDERIMWAIVCNKSAPPELLNKLADKAAKWQKRRIEKILIQRLKSG